MPTYGGFFKSNHVFIQKVLTALRARACLYAQDTAGDRQTKPCPVNFHTRGGGTVYTMPGEAWEAEPVESGPGTMTGGALTALHPGPSSRPVSCSQ